MTGETFFKMVNESKEFEINGDIDHYFVLPKSENMGESEVYCLSPGVFLIFNEIRDDGYSFLPTNSDVLSKDLININVCMEGSCRIVLSDEEYINVSKGRLYVSAQLPMTEIKFPESYYDGFSLYINLCELDKSEYVFLSQGNIDFNDFIKYFGDIKEAFYNFTDDWMDELLKGIWEMRKSNNKGTMRLLAALMVSQVMETSKEYSVPSLITKSQYSAVEICMNLLNEDLSKRHIIEDIADYVGVNPSTLNTYFRTIFGLTFNEILLCKRMELGKDLLMDTELKISEIAPRCGYENFSKFSNAFRKYYGYTPMEFRQSPDKPHILTI